MFPLLAAFLFILPSFGQSLTFDPSTGAALSNDHRRVTLTFSAAVLSNVSSLKACVRVASDGAHYDALGALDSVVIAGGSMEVRFRTVLSQPSMRIKILPGALKDGSGTVLAGEAETDPIDASTPIVPSSIVDETQVIYEIVSNGQTIRTMGCQDSVFTIRMPRATFTIPASQINIESVYDQMGCTVPYKDILVTITIVFPSDDDTRIVEDPATHNSYQIVVKPIDFDIVCTGAGYTIDVTRICAYIERIVAIPDGVDPSKITTGIVLNPDGTFSHVPTSIIIIGGKYFAKINSLTNRISAPGSGRAGGTVLMKTAVDDCDSSPYVSVNLGLSLAPGAAAVIAPAQLSAADVEHSAASLTYAVRRAPSHGRIERSSAPGVPAMAFTQSEINSGLIRYVNTDIAVAADTFAFMLADGAGGTSNVNTFSIAIGSATLPVVVENFCAMKTVGGVMLAWRTASEVNNYGFEIERKRVDAERAGEEAVWARIGFVEGHGTTDAPHEYSFRDHRAGAGSLRYRLTQTDRDGAAAPIAEIGIEAGADAPAEYMLGQNYPNPFNPSTQIVYSIPTEARVRLSVYDVLGREVARLVDGNQSAGRHTCTFDAGSYEAGMYFYTLRAGSFSSARKMVLAR